MSASERLAELATPVEDLQATALLPPGAPKPALAQQLAGARAQRPSSQASSANGSAAAASVGGSAAGRSSSALGGSALSAGGLDVRGDGVTTGTSFTSAGESLGWLRCDSHQERLRRLREKYGYEQ